MVFDSGHLSGESLKEYAGIWVAADLVSDWFRRNMRIYSNVVQLVDSPNERVLVIFGAGHLGWLRYDFAGDPSLRVRKLAEILEMKVNTSGV